MTTLEPYEAIVAIERSLRQLLDHVFSRELGPNWYDTLSNKSIQRNAAVAREQYEKTAVSEGRHPGATGALDFTRLDDLVTMAQKEWDPLKPALGEKTDMTPLLARAIEYRHDAMHGRTTAASARDILSGLAGELQNRIGKYMSSERGTGPFYPRVTAASDSTGRVASSNELAIDSHVLWVGNSRSDGGVWPVDVRVGQSVEVTVVSADPEGRDIEVMATRNANLDFDRELAGEHALGYHEQVPSGATVRVTHTFTEVASSAYVSVLGRAVGSEYFPNGGPGTAHFVAVFAFRVLPVA